MLVDSLDPAKIQLKVLDFGIAKILEADSSDVRTSTGQFMGTAQYTSPEQASGGQIDHRSDIYTVGVILYELLTGARPFTGPIHQLIFGHLYSPPPRSPTGTPRLRAPRGRGGRLPLPGQEPRRPAPVGTRRGRGVLDGRLRRLVAPRTRPESWSVPIPNPAASPGSVRSADLPATEKASQAGDQAAPPARSAAAGRERPRDRDDWESPQTPTTFPATGSDRGGPGLSSPSWSSPCSHWPACLLIPISVLGPRFPRGYRAENRLDMVNGRPGSWCANPTALDSSGSRGGPS